MAGGSNPEGSSNHQAIWDRVGSFGRWQLMIFLITSVTTFFNAVHDFDYIYIAAETDHWCRIPQFENSSWTMEEIKNITIPREVRNNKNIYSRCYAYDRDYDHLSQLSYSEAWDQTEVNTTPNQTYCKQWVYDRSVYHSTLVTEWDLVCHRKAMMSTIQSVFLFGILVSAIICGLLSDKYGRRPVILVNLVVMVISAFIEAFAPDYFTYVIFRFVVAFSVYGAYLVSFILMTEVVGVQHRSSVGLIYQIPFSFGFMAIPAVAYFLRDWWTLQYAYSFPNIIVLPILWFIPESPRWLITKGKLTEATTVLYKAAKMNKRNISEADIQKLVEEVYTSQDKPIIKEETKCRASWSKFISLFRTKEMLRRTLACYFAWFVVSMVYYGVSLNAVHLPFNPYLATFLMGAAELPADLLSIPLIDYFGRKSITCITFFISGVACLLQLLPLQDVGWLVTVFATTGKLCSTATFCILYLYGAELFPTEIRNFAVGGASVAARFGSMLAPYTLDMLRTHDQRIPISIFGVFGLAAAATSLFLPETNKKQLPETIEDVERNRYEEIPL